MSYRHRVVEMKNWYTNCIIKANNHNCKKGKIMVALFVVLTFIIFLVADYFLLKTQKKEHPAFATFPMFDKSQILFPMHYLFSKGHVWLKPIQDNIYKLGIDEFIIKALGALKIVEFVPAGTAVQKGDVILRAAAGRHTFTFRSPINGTVTGINNAVYGHNITDCYENDWQLLVTPSEKIDSSLFISKENSSGWLQQEFRRLKDFLTVQTAEPALAGITMADGGNIVEGAITHLTEKAINEFESSFLAQ